MNYYFVFLFIIIIAIYIINRGLRGIPRNVTSLNRILSELLRRGYHHGFLILKVPYSKKFLQVRKYINGPGVYGIELGFPNTKWSYDEYFKKTEEYCIENDCDYIKRYDGDMEFLYIDFGQDLSYAYETVKQLLYLLFNIDESGKVVVHLDNASLKDELIDR